MSEQTHIITSDNADERLDVTLAQLQGITRSQASKLLREHRVTLNGEPVAASHVPAPGDVVAVSAVVIADTPAIPDIPILYQDSDVLVVNKPAGLVVHASESGRLQPTVAAFALAHGVVDEDEERPGIVHRLDKDTSGVMILACNQKSKEWLQAQFKERHVAKTYLALVRGHLRESEALINLPIGRDRKQPLKRAVTPGAREARTHYRVLEEYAGASLLEIDLQTGRTHQIRVHFSHLGHPVIGDALYGDAQWEGLDRQFLHAASLTITLLSGKSTTFTAPLPPELERVLQDYRSTV